MKPFSNPPHNPRPPPPKKKKKKEKIYFTSSDPHHGIQGIYSDVYFQNSVRKNL